MFNDDGSKMEQQPKLPAFKRINPEIKSRWLAALRSGKYKQGSLVLQSAATNRFCCLGVLCEVLKVEAQLEIRKQDRLITYNDCSSMPPAEVVLLAGLSSKSVDFLALMNDREPIDEFVAISAFIEKHL